MFDANGYDPVTGENSGNLGFQSQQGYVNGRPYYAPAPFNPGSYGGPDAPGYINFGSDYDPNTNQNDYTYSPFYYVPSDPISYGSAPSNQLAPGQGNPTLNGIDFTPSPSQETTQYSQPSMSARMQTAPNPTAFYYGNNGSSGVVQGLFSNNTPGESSQFYQNEPSTLTQGDIRTDLGRLNNPNPALQALTMSRSQP